jgi:hypothetical protein
MAEIGILVGAELSEKLAEGGQQPDMDERGAEPAMARGGLRSGRTLLGPSGVGVRRSLLRR